MNKRKICALLLAAVLTATMIGGCKSREEEPAVSDDWVGVIEQEKEEANVEKPQDGEEEKAPSEIPSPEQEEQPAPQEPAGKDPVPQSKDPEPKPPAQEQVPVESDKEQDAEEPVVKPVEKEESGVPITFLSQNIRHAGSSLGTKGDGIGNNIYNRMRRFKSLVQARDPDIIFYSEARIGAISFMEEDPYFSQVYTLHYRYENGVQAEPLIYKSAKYEAVDKGFFWQSPTPTIPSGYDGTETIVSWAILRDKASGAEFYCASTHFRPGNKMEIALPSMEQFIKIAQEMDEDAYAFFGGDFNVHYRTDVYNLMMDWDAVIDLRDMAMHMKKDGLVTFGGMQRGHDVNYDAATENPDLMPAVAESGHQIDYVMAKPHPHMAVDYYGFDYKIYDYPEDGVQPGHISDHYGLIVKVRIQTDADYSQYQRQYDYEDTPVYF